MTLTVYKAWLTWVSNYVNKTFILTTHDHLFFTVTILDKHMHLRNLFLWTKFNVIDEFKVFSDIKDINFAFVASNIEIFTDSTCTECCLTNVLEFMLYFKISLWKYDKTVWIIVDKIKVLCHLIKEGATSWKVMYRWHLIEALLKSGGYMLSSCNMTKALRI